MSLPSISSDLVELLTLIFVSARWWIPLLVHISSSLPCICSHYKLQMRNWCIIGWCMYLHCRVSFEWWITLIYFCTCSSSPQSSSSGLLTLIVRKDTNACMLDLAWIIMNSSCEMVWWDVTAFLSDNFLVSVLHWAWKRWSVAGVAYQISPLLIICWWFFQYA